MSTLALDSTVVSSLISALLGGALVAMVNHHYTRRRERERGDESLSAKFVDLRLAPYTELMQALAVVSTDRIRSVCQTGSVTLRPGWRRCCTARSTEP